MRRQGAAAPPHGILIRSEHQGRQNRNSRVIFTTNARFRRAIEPRRGSSGSVSCSSVQTTKNSLPGRYSQRKRTLLLKVWSAELYWRSALANIRGLKP